MENEVWYKMDNVAKVFLATYNKRDTRSFRVSCTLKEKIDPELLQKALEATVLVRPQFQVSIHKGLFWHYMGVNSKLPVVTEENERPCPVLYGTQKEGQLHYKVSYFRNRINLDMFHALSDGNGGMEFLNIIVLHYLQLKYPGKLDQVSMLSGAAADDLEQDSFRQFYKSGKLSKEKRLKSYHIRGRKLPYDQLQFFELHMSVQSVLQLAKNAGVSLTSFLGANMMMAIYKDMPLLQRNKPITISMPVNLRNYFPSETSRNFFNSVYVSQVLTGKETLEELAKEFDQKLKQELTPDRIRKRMDNYEKVEQLFFVRMVPLFIKNPVVALFTRQEGENVTAVLSNMGKLQVPGELQEYIDGYAGFCSTSNLFMTVCSYQDDLTFGISSCYRHTSVLKSFVRQLANQGVEVKLYATDVVK